MTDGYFSLSGSDLSGVLCAAVTAGAPGSCYQKPTGLVNVACSGAFFLFRTPWTVAEEMQSSLFFSVPSVFCPGIEKKISLSRVDFCTFFRNLCVF